MPQRKRVQPKAPPSKRPAADPSQARSRPAAAKKRPGKSIIDQKQRPWGTIATVAAIVAFAAVIAAYLVVTHKSTPAANAGCTQTVGANNELKCAADIKGVTFTPGLSRNHAKGVVQYDASPPVGGDHSAVLADCTGTVYAEPIANENAVHALEHGAVWITYKPGLPRSEIAALADLVSGHDYTLMTPYPGLSAPISVQSWGYQLKLESATDLRLRRFITVLRTNPKTTPEPGASCADPPFLKNPSTPGHPLV